MAASGDAKTSCGTWTIFNVFIRRTGLDCKKLDFHDNFKP